MLSNKTQEALKVFLEGVKNETGMDVTDVKLYQHSKSSQRQIEQMKNVGFKEGNMTGTHWLNNEGKVKVDDVDIDFTCFYKEEMEEPLTYCTAENCLDEPDPNSEDGLCTNHMENQMEEWEAELKREEEEYRQSKI